MSDGVDIPCPACGFLTLEGAYGSYAICDVCDWEDDQVQLANPACGGGANSESLIEAQSAAMIRYPVGVRLVQGIMRDPRWRPLDHEEQHTAEAERDEKYWKNKGIIGLHDCYWMRGESRTSAG